MTKTQIAGYNPDTTQEGPQICNLQGRQIVRCCIRNKSGSIEILDGISSDIQGKVMTTLLCGNLDDSKICKKSQKKCPAGDLPKKTFNF